VPLPRWRCCMQEAFLVYVQETSVLLPNEEITIPDVLRKSLRGYTYGRVCMSTGPPYSRVHGLIVSVHMPVATAYNLGTSENILWSFSSTCQDAIDCQHHPTTGINLRRVAQYLPRQACSALQDSQLILASCRHFHS
jgi:hypothetical protein